MKITYKIILIILVSLLLITLANILGLSAYMLKLSGGSFVLINDDRQEIIYNGEVIFNVPENCESTEWIKDLERVTVSCGDVEHIFIKGVKQ